MECSSVWYRNGIKPLFDRTGALVLLLLFAPVIAAVALWIRLRLGSPVLFAQIRPGLDGTLFTIYKFRTMSNEKDETGELLPDAQRLGPTGRGIRGLSLDELPQLFNILKGEMSFIGPRPLLPEYLPLYNARQQKRHQVRPGITGWAQVNGRNTLSWPERFELDVWYVEHQSLWLDMRILLMTVMKVLKREGVSQEGHVTMEKFHGNQ